MDPEGFSESARPPHKPLLSGLISSCSQHLPSSSKWRCNHVAGAAHTMGGKEKPLGAEGCCLGWVQVWSREKTGSGQKTYTFLTFFYMVVRVDQHGMSKLFTQSLPESKISRRGSIFLLSVGVAEWHLGRESLLPLHPSSLIPAFLHLNTVMPALWD